MHSLYYPRVKSKRSIRHEFPNLLNRPKSELRVQKKSQVKQVQRRQKCQSEDRIELGNFPGKSRQNQQREKNIVKKSQRADTKPSIQYLELDDNESYGLYFKTFDNANKKPQQNNSQKFQHYKKVLQKQRNKNKLHSQKTPIITVKKTQKYKNRGKKTKEKNESCFNQANTKQRNGINTLRPQTTKSSFTQYKMPLFVKKLRGQCKDNLINLKNKGDDKQILKQRKKHQQRKLFKKVYKSKRYKETKKVKQIRAYSQRTSYRNSQKKYQFENINIPQRNSHRNYNVTMNQINPMGSQMLQRKTYDNRKQVSKVDIKLFDSDDEEFNEFQNYLRKKQKEQDGYKKEIKQKLKRSFMIDKKKKKQYNLKQNINLEVKRNYHKYFNKQTNDWLNGITKAVKKQEAKNKKKYAPFKIQKVFNFKKIVKIPQKNDKYQIINLDSNEKENKPSWVQNLQNVVFKDKNKGNQLFNTPVKNNNTLNFQKGEGGKQFFIYKKEQNEPLQTFQSYGKSVSTKILKPKFKYKKPKRKINRFK